MYVSLYVSVLQYMFKTLQKAIKQFGYVSVNSVVAKYYVRYMYEKRIITYTVATLCYNGGGHVVIMVMAVVCNGGGRVVVMVMALSTMAVVVWLFDHPAATVRNTSVGFKLVFARSCISIYGGRHIICEPIDLINFSPKTMVFNGRMVEQQIVVVGWGDKKLSYSNIKYETLYVMCSFSTC